LNLLSGKLDLTTHELSRILNSVIKKSFNDFINEYRVKAVARKMQDPAYNHITLLGIAYESGFNSQSTFTRIFKQTTGKTPLEYKNELRKDYPSYNLGSLPRPVAVVLNHKITPNLMFKNYLKVVPPAVRGFQLRIPIHGNSAFTGQLKPTKKPLNFR
jgi:putative ABC transport system permease protein